MSTELYVGDLRFASRRDEVSTSDNLGLEGSNGISGWYDTPDIKTDSESRLGADGSFRRKLVHYSARSVEVSFMSLANTREEHLAIWERLTALHRTQQVVRLVDKDDTFVTAVLEFEFPPERLSKVVVGSMLAVADDPIRYSWEQQEVVLSAGVRRGALDYPITYPIDYVGAGSGVSATGAINNKGNTTGYPTIIVNGPLYGGFTLSDNNGRAIVFNNDVFPGVPVVIDCKNRTAMVQGVNVSWALSRREWFDVPRESSLSVTLEPNEDIPVGQAWANLTMRDTWI